MGRWAGGAGLGGAGRHRRPALRRPTVLDDGRLVLRGRRGQWRDQRSRTPRRSGAALHIGVRRLGAGQGRGSGGARRFRLVAPAAHRRGSGRPGRDGQRAARGGPALPDRGGDRARRHGVDGCSRGRPVPYADARRRRRADVGGRRPARLSPAGQAHLEQVRSRLGARRFRARVHRVRARVLCRRCADPAPARRPVAGRAHGVLDVRPAGVRLGDGWRPRALFARAVQRPHGRPHAVVDGRPDRSGARGTGHPCAAGAARSAGARRAGTAPAAACRPSLAGRAGRHASARRVRVVRRQPLRALLHVAVRHPDGQPSRARRDGVPFPGRWVPVLLRARGRRSHARAPAADRSHRHALRGDDVPRVLLDRHHGRRHRAGPRLFPGARPPLFHRPAGRPAPRRRHRLGAGRAACAAGPGRDLRTVDPD